MVLGCNLNHAHTIPDGPTLISSPRIWFVFIETPTEVNSGQYNCYVIQRNLTTVACDRHNKINPHEILFAAGIPKVIE
jgi:hypothetical protein